jgi:hypothetical protein
MDDGKRRRSKLKPKPIGILAAGALGLSLLLIGGASFAFDENAEDASAASASPAPSIDPNSEAQSRLAAANEALELERDRIETAETAFQEELASTPSVDAARTVSLTSAVRASELLPLLPKELRVNEVFIWLWDGQSLHPVVGEFTNGHGVDLGDPAGALAYIQQDLLRYLDQSIAGLSSSLESESWDDVETRQSWEDQLKEAGRLRGLVLDGEFGVFGFSCECSISDLVALEKDALVPAGAGLRAVEAFGEYQTPMRPAEPLRDAVIAGGGTL